MLDKVAGGIEKLVTHRCSMPRRAKPDCQCATCSHTVGHMSETYIEQEPMLISPMQETVQPVPHVHPAAPVMPAQPAPRTTIRRDMPNPPTLPLPSNNFDRPGRAFDELNDPFEDDSASHTAQGPRGILQATFAQGDTETHSHADSLGDSGSARRPEQAQQQVDVYADYFRE
ncbi:hypothetical protein RRSWK_06087 [Rhodopirellula sp. SWK7]|nr:hypothetical protein RRSWK_06087 [Rhodopirellula sp. SWK7]